MVIAGGKEYKETKWYWKNTIKTKQKNQSFVDINIMSWIFFNSHNLMLQDPGQFCWGLLVLKEIVNYRGKTIELLQLSQSSWKTAMRPSTARCPPRAALPSSHPVVWTKIMCYCYRYQHCQLKMSSILISKK